MRQSAARATGTSWRRRRASCFVIQSAGCARASSPLIPVYRQGLPLDSLEERRRNTLGMIVGVFQTAAVFDAILNRAKLPQNVDLYVFMRRIRAPTALPVYHARGGQTATSRSRRSQKKR